MMWTKAPCLITMMSVIATDAHPSFKEAQPVWPEGLSTEMNLFVGFRSVFDAAESDEATLRITGHSLYRIHLNGQYIGQGPARGPHHYFRVDEWDLSPALRKQSNVLAIEVAGYNANSFYLLDLPSFLQAEVIADGAVLAATDTDGSDFSAEVLDYRIQKVPRYTFQRTFAEIYALDEDTERWRTDPGRHFGEAQLEHAGPRALISRGVPYPRINRHPALWHLDRGELEHAGLPQRIRRPSRALDTGVPGRGVEGWPETEQTMVPYLTLQEYSVNVTARFFTGKAVTQDEEFPMPSNSFHTFDFGTNLTGFIGATFTCTQPATLYLSFDELYLDGNINWLRMKAMNIVTYELQPGTYHLESFEPYTLRYLRVMVTEGEGTLSDVYLRDFANPDVWEATFSASDMELSRIFDAARETYRQNALDVFMDCPSRERAGWLCDSFWTARTASVLSGNTAVEDNFFENYVLPDRFEYLPEGMVPMCYPSDHPRGRFIPNWALWFVMQLGEYAGRSLNEALVANLQPRVEKLFDYFREFENEDGLLEGLESWVFVEWSKANQFVQDVNYPSNMLYAGALEAAAKVYDRADWAKRAGQVRETVREQSFNGAYFVDNAVREDGELVVTENTSETCQYYAFFFEVATPETHPALYKKLIDEFGPDRQEGVHPEVYRSNQLPGNVLRLEILSRNGLSKQVLEESVDYHLYMADRTGTVWEHSRSSGSCNHGFSSHIAFVLYRDALGLHEIDIRNKRVTVRLADIDLDWCEGRIPTPDGPVAMRWQKTGDALEYTLDLPAGYTVLEKQSGIRCKRVPRLSNR